MGYSQKKSEKTSNGNGESNVVSLDQIVSQVSDEKSCNPPCDASVSRKENILDRVSFRQENFIESLHGCSEKYDTILW